MLQLLTLVVSLERYMGFIKSDEYTNWEETDPNSSFKNISCRKDSFQKLTKFSQGNNVLYAATSNRDGFLWRVTCVSSSQVNLPIWNKDGLSAP
jgi:uncharacterized HAD superfamily protein